jgi:hypothetical protein
MQTYDDLISELEDAWTTVGLHEHAFVESVVPSTHDRTVKIELFPDHDEPMSFSNMPPWVELNLTWSAIHQLRAEGRPLPLEPLELVWTYTASLQNGFERSDGDLVRSFQRAVQAAFRRYYPAEADLLEPLNIEVRRIYQGGSQPQLEYVQLVSTNITDLSDQWGEGDQRNLRALIRTELQLTATILAFLSEAFAPNGSGGYHSVDAA